MKKTVKCLVTGGAGFIGSHLCDALITLGYEVFCVDNFITGSKKNIANLLHHFRFHFLLHDVINPLHEVISDKLKNLDYVYHLASPASPPQYIKYSVETLLVNSVGTFNMLEIAKKYKSRFLLASTSEVYGNPKEHPQKESYYGHVNPIGVRACYDEGKRFAEAITMEYFRQYKLKVRIVRIFNTFGPRMQKHDGRVVSNFVTQAITQKPLTIYGQGTQTRSLCYVSDMVEGIIKTAETENLDGEVINLGNPDEKTVTEIADEVIKLSKSVSQKTFISKRLADDPDRRKPDISKAQKLLGWQPKVFLKEGLNKTIEYFRSL